MKKITSVAATRRKAKKANRNGARCRRTDNGQSQVRPQRPEQGDAEQSPAAIDALDDEVRLLVEADLVRQLGQDRRPPAPARARSTRSRGTALLSEP